MIKRKTIGKIQLIAGIVFMIGLVIAGIYANNKLESIFPHPGRYESYNITNTITRMDLINNDFNSMNAVLNLTEVVLFAVVAFILSLILILEGLANINEENEIKNT